VNGRETFLAAIRWEDDWPVFDEKYYSVPEADTGFDEEFTTPLGLHPRWISPGVHPARFTAPAQRGGLALTAAPSPSDTRHLLGVRARDEEWEASAVVDGSDVRLLLRLDDTHWAGIEVRGASLVARTVIGGLDHVLAEVPRPEPSPVTLSIRAVEPEPGSQYEGGPDVIELGHQDNSGFRRLARLDGRYLSTEVAGGFTGRVIAVEPLADTQVLRRFSYRPGQRTDGFLPG
jgi:hypothetical protein